MRDERTEEVNGNKKERREFREYLRSLSDQEFRELLEDAGFEVEEGNGEFVNMEESE